MRNRLTTGPSGLLLPAFVLLVLASSGCVGGQSGTESGYCSPEVTNNWVPEDGSIGDTFIASDEDGGVEMEPDADAKLSAAGTEGSDVPDQCIVPEE